MFFKIAYLYVIRKKVKTIIMFMLMFIISILLFATNILHDTIKNISNEVYRNSNFGFSIKSSSEENGELLLKNLEHISNIPNIRDVNYRYATPIWLLDKKIVEEKSSISLDNNDNKNNFVMMDSNTNTSQNIDFKSEVLKLVKGRHITAEDTHKILIHEKFASLNGLDIGSKISLKGSKESDINNTYEVIGIYSGEKSNKFQGMSSDFIENTIYMDYKSGQELIKNIKDAYKVTSIDYFVTDSKKLDDTIKSVEKSNIKDIEILKSNRNFEAINNSLESIEKVIKVVKLSGIISSILILSLVLIFWIRERIYEIGILLSIGNSKLKIILQHILELIFISIFSVALSNIFGNIILTKVMKGIVKKISGDELPEIISQQISLVKIDVVDTTLVFGILCLIIVCSVILTSLSILRMKPKNILSKMS